MAEHLTAAEQYYVYVNKVGEYIYPKYGKKLRIINVVFTFSDKESIIAKVDIDKGKIYQIINYGKLGEGE